MTKVFNEVFNKYDLMNDLMSFGAHRIWKSKLIDWMSPRQNQRLIDVASGTGDVARAFLKETNFSGQVSCVEPNKNMLKIGEKKLKNLVNVKWYCAEAEKLPFKDETFDKFLGYSKISDCIPITYGGTTQNKLYGQWPAYSFKNWNEGMTLNT